MSLVYVKCILLTRSVVYDAKPLIESNNDNILLYYPIVLFTNIEIV